MGLPELNYASFYPGTLCDRDVRVIDHGVVSLVRTASPSGLNLYFKCRLGVTVNGTLYLQKYGWPSPTFGERFAQIFYDDLYNDYQQRAIGGRTVIFSEDATHWHIGIWRDKDYYELDASQAGGSAATSAIWHGRTLVTVDGTTNIYRAGVRGDVFSALPTLLGKLDHGAYSITQVGRTYWVSEDGSNTIYIYAGEDIFSGTLRDPIGSVIATFPFRSMMFDGRCFWILLTSGLLVQNTIKW